MTTNGQGLAEQGIRYQAGDNVSVHRNQGDREATVLAVIGDEVLIEYTMPKGTTALNITTHKALFDDEHAGYDANHVWHEGGQYKAVSYRGLPTKWLKAVVEEGLEWVGYDQRNHRVVKMRGGWYDVRPCGEPTPTPLQMLEERIGLGAGLGIEVS